jgi:DNA-binding transcriptional LysR family regulator
MDTGLYELMRVFVRVADAGSFTSVASEMGQTQPTVSRQVAALETHLGRRLLTRTTRSLALTEDGRVFLESARLALEAMDEASGSLSDRGGAVSGIVRISASVAFGRLNLVPLLGRLMAAYPALDVDLVLDDRFVDIVEEGVDLAIRIGEMPDSGLVARRIGEIERLAVAAPAYWDRKGRPQHPRDLKYHDCLLYTSAQGRDVWSFETPQGLVKVKVKGRVRLSVSDAMREAVLAGLGVGLTPRSFWTDELVSGRVEQVFTDLPPRRSSIYAVFPTRRLIAARVRAVADFLAEEFAKCPAMAMR